MQKVIVKSISIKRGTNKQGEWINTRITSDTGVVFSTFHKGAQEIAEGDTVEMEVTVSDKGNNFDEYNILEKGSAPAATPAAAPPSGGPYKRDVEAIRFEYGQKAHLQAIERASIEAQTAYNGIMSLAVEHLHQQAVPGHEVAAAIEEAIAWARVKMKATLATQAPSAATGAKSGNGKSAAPGKEQAPAEDTAPAAPSFLHVGALLKWCADQGIARPAFMTIVGVKEEELPKVDIDTAYTLIKDHLREHGKLEDEIFGSKE